MASDEREIRAMHSIWIDAVNAGDLARLLTLVAEDVVFLTPGEAPVGREGFSSNFMAAHQQMRICCTPTRMVIRHTMSGLASSTEKTTPSPATRTQTRGRIRRLMPTPWN